MGFGVFALAEYQEEKQIEEISKDKVRMRSYMEGIMVELGNYEKHITYCADPTANFQQNVFINQLTTLGESLSRMYQLKEFQTDFYVLAPDKHIEKIQNTLNRESYLIQRNRFIVKTYDEAIDYYKKRLEKYDDVDGYLKNVSEDKEIVEIFDNLYKKIRSVA